MLLGVRGEDVRVLPLDDCNVAACQFIKIDVEGMEPAVLRGGAADPHQVPAAALLENDRQHNSAEVIRLLQEVRLPALLAPAATLHFDNFRGDPENIFPGIISINMLCVPAERPQNIAGMREVTGPDDDWHSRR